MAPRSGRRPAGGRVGLVLEDQGIAVVNKSNRDVWVNDAEPPFETVVFEAGNIDSNTPRNNCVQFWTMESARKFQAMAGNALEFMTIPDGRTVLLKARELGSFEEAYKLLRGENLLDRADTPAQVRERENVLTALRRAGVPEQDIPKTKSVKALRKFHADWLSGREHIRLQGIEGGVMPIETGGNTPVATVDISHPAERALELRELETLRTELEKLGVAWNPSHKAPALKAQLEAARMREREETLLEPEPESAPEAPAQPASEDDLEDLGAPAEEID